MFAMPPILSTTVPRSVPEQRGVQRGGERSALPPSGDVATAKIGDDGDAAGFGEPRRIGKLGRELELGPMTHRLPVQADCGNVRRFETRIGKNPRNGSRAAIHQRIGGERRAMQFVGAAFLQSIELGPKGGVERNMAARADSPGRGAEIGQHRVDAVDAGARHQADVELAGQPLLDSYSWRRGDVAERRFGKRRDARGIRRSVGGASGGAGSAIVIGLKILLSTRNVVQMRARSPIG